MDNSVKNDILARLQMIGDNGLGHSEKKWSQLAALREGALVLNKRNKDARAALRASKLTVANMERVLQELGGVTVTDQTMRNNGALLERFMLTFEEDKDIEVHKENKKLKEKIDTLNDQIEKMETRDADCQDALLELERLKAHNKQLEQDKNDLLARLVKLSHKGKSVVMTQLDLTKSTEKPS